jgi:hypothetical protein
VVRLPVWKENTQSLVSGKKGIQKTKSCVDLRGCCMFVINRVLEIESIYWLTVIFNRVTEVK